MNVMFVYECNQTGIYVETASNQLLTKQFELSRAKSGERPIIAFGGFVELI